MLTSALFQAAYEIQLVLSARQASLDEQYTQARASWQAGELTQATQQYRELLAQDPQRAEGWQDLTEIYLETHAYPEAWNTVQEAVQRAGNHARTHYLWGKVAAKLPDSEVAQAWYADHSPDSAGVLVAQGRWAEALAMYQQLHRAAPQDPVQMENLSFMYALIGDEVRATRYQGHACVARGDDRGAVTGFERFQELGGVHAQVSLALTASLVRLGEWDRAWVIYAQADLDQLELYWQWVQHLHQYGATDAAIVVAQAGAARFPEALELQLAANLLVPILYRDEQELHQYRVRFRVGLARLIQLHGGAQFWQGLSRWTNFYQPYQGYPDLDLQVQYGNLVSRLAQTQYPSPIHSTRPPGRIRIGYVSCNLNNHTVGKFTLGWLRQRDRAGFRVYTYSLGETDLITEEFTRQSDQFYQLPPVLATVAQQIARDQLQILVYLDIGMDPVIGQLASLRLAPVQCTTWCHPVTSGLATVDYFLSSDLMEPDHGQAHYCETLVRLPNLGVSYPRPRFPVNPKTRLDFGLDPGRVVYLSCQSLFKYLPQYDGIYPAIAQQVPQAQFVFLSHSSAPLTAIFRERLARAFAQVGLSAADYCVLLPRLLWHDYGRLNQLADVFMDTLGWSGGNTCLEALACGLPVVTCPGGLLRGRHGYGILRLLGMTETMATTPAELVMIAARLGLDGAWRVQLQARILANQGRLFDDPVCIKGLEDFYRRVVR